METSAQSIRAPAAVYEIAGRRFEIGSRGFADAVADAHSAHQRPRCMCLRSGDGQGVEMYVARLGDGYIVKRMPDTGSHHAPNCPSYEPPAEFSGLGQVLGSAITEDPATGETTLKLDFPLTKMPGRSQMPPAGGDSDSVASDGTRLSLRGLLHYLWDQAELTRWHPGFAGKRTWATVRRHLLHAAEHKLARGNSMRTRLYVPEPFASDLRDEINARRLAQWQPAIAPLRRPQHLMLLIGEVKEIVPARYGYRAIIKHVPDQAFAVDDQLYRRIGRRFEPELELWASSDSARMVMIGTFLLTASGTPTVVELSLMPVTAEWIPIENSFESLLTEMLVSNRRHFFKALRYDSRPLGTAPFGTLLDSAGGPIQMLIDSTTNACATTPLEPRGQVNQTAGSWTWRTSNMTMPNLPTLAE